MKKLMVFTLIVVNVALLIGLATRFAKPREAQAQPLGLSGNYLMVAGNVLGTTEDAVYLLDLGSRQLYALLYDKTRKDILVAGPRDLLRDLGYAPAPAGGRGVRRAR